MKPQTFRHPVFGEVRTVEVDDRLYFVGVDVARALQYANPAKAVLDHCKGVSKLGIPSAGGVQETNIIPEGDVYRLIIKAAEQSRNPEIRARAEQFERWVFDEVLPALRRTGVYSVRPVSAGPDDPIEKADRILGLLRKYSDLLHPKINAAIQVQAYKALVRPDPLWETLYEFADANGLPRPGRDIGIWWDESVPKLDDVMLTILMKTLDKPNPTIRRMRATVEAELRRRGVDAAMQRG